MKLGIDVNRHKEVIVKAISGLLLLMLKHFKLNHIYQVCIKDEPCHEKTCFFHMQKQRCRSAAGNPAADQRRGNLAADQHLCFRYIYTCNKMPPLP